MKVKMLNTCSLAGYGKEHTFFKGKIYLAFPATNQPDWEKKQLIFVEKNNGNSLLIGAGDYEIIK